MRILDAVNKMLATMGEAPLNALTDPHAFKDAGITELESANLLVQSEGWWYNTEKFKGYPDATTSQVWVSNDVISFISDKADGVVYRGRTLYDTTNSTDRFTSTITGRIVRLIPYENLPTIGAALIEAMAVWSFQKHFDGDGSRTQSLAQRVEQARVLCRSEDIRQSKFNFMDNSPQVLRVKSRYGRA